MIKIINGTYGHREGKTIIPKNATSKPFSATGKKEAELVEKGIAVYVNEVNFEDDEEEDNGLGNLPPGLSQSGTLQ